MVYLGIGGVTNSQTATCTWEKTISFFPYHKTEALFFSHLIRISYTCNHDLVLILLTHINNAPLVNTYKYVLSKKGYFERTYYTSKVLPHSYQAIIDRDIRVEKMQLKVPLFTNSEIYIGTLKSGFKCRGLADHSLDFILIFTRCTVSQRNLLLLIFLWDLI